MSYNYEQPPPPPSPPAYGSGMCVTPINQQNYEIVDGNGNIIIENVGQLAAVNQACMKMCMNQHTYTVKNQEGMTMKVYDMDAIKNNCL